MGFGALPVVVLDKGEFVCDELQPFDKDFLMQALEFKSKYLYATVCENDDDSQCVYSYDKITDTKGRLIEETLAEWKEDKEKFECRKYFDVVGIVLDGDNEGEPVILSVSPSSVKKFSAYIQVNLNKIKNLRYTEVVTKVGIGAAIGKGTKSFKPWTFSFVRKL